MRDIEKVHIGDYVSVFNLRNGKYLTIKKTEFDNEKYLRSIYNLADFFSINTPYDDIKQKYEKITLVINISNKCNLNCSYCFSNQSKTAKMKDMTYDQIIRFINIIKLEYPDALHYHLDVTGDGEPLLRFPLIKKINEYLVDLRSEKQMYTLGFCTNGTLLSNDIADYFKKNDIYYGISIDGPKLIHDKYRVNHKQEGTYKSIMKKIKKIDSRYIGVASTISSTNTDIVKNIKLFHKYFDVISMKPIRETNPSKGAILSSNVDQLIQSYDKLFGFLINQTLKLNTWYILKLIKGEDMFGRILKRVFINQQLLTRCDAGFSRYSVDSNGDIYICGATRDPKFKIGDLNKGLDYNNISNIQKLQLDRNYCKDCWAKSICGGICPVYYEQLKDENLLEDKALCKLNKHLIKLAIHFKNIIFEKHFNMYKKIEGVCMDKHNV